MLSSVSHSFSNPLARFFSHSNAPVIGIDLGTTNSCVSVVEGGTPKVIANSEGLRTTPSIVAFNKNGEMIVGEQAKRQQVANPKSTFSATKRLIGRNFDDKSTKRAMKMVNYDVVKAENGEAWVRTEQGKIYSPSQIGGFILQKMKETAENYLGQKVKDAIVTVPAYFNNMQRQATKDAGKLAGLNVMRTINEPTAAALAYGLNRKQGQTIAVYDLGGGTFDISILEISEDGVFEVKSTNGNTFLGGEDFDNVLANYIIRQFYNDEKIDLSKDPMAVARIREAAEKAKCELSAMNHTEVNLPYITVTPAGPKHLSMPLSRAKFEELTMPLIRRTMDPVSQSIKDSGMSPNEINEVILVGGMTRVPKVINTVRDFFGKEPFRGVNPDEVVSIGASIQGSVLTGGLDEILLLDVTPLSLGIETMGGVFTRLIPRNTVVPTKKTEIFSTGVDGQKNVAIRVYQGERELVKDNKFLGEFNLVGIPPQPRGMPQIEVSFEIDPNSIVHVSARDAESGKEQKIEIKQSGGLTQEEIEKMIKESEKHAKEDAKKRDAIIQSYDIRGFITEIQRQIKLNKDRIPEWLVDKVQEAIKEQTAAFDTLDLDKIMKAFKKLKAVALEMPANLKVE